MATFEVQVEGLTGLDITASTAPTQEELSLFLTAGAKEIINVLPPSLLDLCSAEQSFTSTAIGSEAETLNTGKVSSIFRNDGEIDQPCRRISDSNKGRFSDPSDMSYATITDPVYYIANNKINALPNGGSCKYTEVQYPTVNYGDSSIGTISLEGVTATKANPAVFSYTAHGLSAGNTVLLSNFSEMTEVNGMTTQVTDTLTANTFRLEGVDSSNYSAAETTGGNVVKLGGFPDEAEYLVALYGAIKALQNKMSSKVDDLPSDISEIALTLTGESLPTFTAPDSFIMTPAPIGADIDFSNVPATPVFVKQSLTLSDFPSMVWSFPSVPTAPSILETLVTISGTAPTYNPPVLSPDFPQVDTYVDTDEDIELASTKLQEIQTQIQEYGSRMQNSLNKFNKENIEYQAKLQIDIQTAQMEDSNESKKLQKFQNEIGNYSAEVNKVVSDNQGRLSEWQQKSSTQIQKYSTDIQNESTKVNFELSVFTQEVQKATQKYQAETGYDLGKYSSEIQNQSQKFTSDLQKNTDTFRTSMERYINEMNKVLSENRDKITKYSSDIQNYSSKIQKHSVDYQWLQSQYQQLSSDYDKGLQFLISGGLPQRQQ